MKFYSLKKILAKHCRYNIIFGLRSNGKSYAVLIKLYQDKTTLKGVEGKEQEYQHAKGLLNSTFGMCCTDISKDLVTYIDNWDVEKADISENLKKYNNSPKRFLFYPWGIFICALARRNLWSGILEFGNDYVYADTDSIKCMNIDKHLKYITEYNRMCSVKLKLMCKHYINYVKGVQHTK